MRCLVIAMLVGILPHAPNPSAPVVALTFSPDGNCLATAGADRVVRLWRPASRVLVSAKLFPVAVTALSFRPDGRCLVIGDATGQIVLWEPRSNRTRFLGAHRGAITSLAFNSDGTAVYSCGQDRMVKVWDGTAGTMRQSIGPLESVPVGLTVAPDGAWLAVAEKSGVEIYAARDGKFVWELPCPDEPVNSLAFSPDGRMLAAACRTGTIRLWSLPEFRAVESLCGHRGPICQLSFDRLGRRLCSVGQNGQTVIWDTVNGAALFSQRFPAPCFCGAIDPVGDVVEIGSARPGPDRLVVPRNIR